MLLSLSVALGCAGLSFNQTVFQIEKAATDGVTAAVHSFNQYYVLQSPTLTGKDLDDLNAKRAQIYGAATNFAKVELVLNQARLDYKANAADTNKANVEIALATLQDSSSNIVALVRQFISKGK